MAFKISNNATLMSCAAGEPIVFSYQDCSVDGVPRSLVNRAFVWALRDAGGSRIEIGYYNAEVIDTPNGQVAVWALRGTVSESLFGNNIKWELSERLDDGRELIREGTFAISESAKRIEDYNGAPISRYISSIKHKNDPATRDSALFEVQTHAYQTNVAAPAFTSQPSISGSTIAGQTLVGSDGVVTDGTMGARQWLRDGVPIAGATSSSYVTLSTDANHFITYRVTAVGAGGTVSATSTAVQIVAPPVVGGPLNRLSLSTSLTRGVPATVNILGATAGSTITGTVPGMTLNSAARTLTGTPTGLSFLLTETEGSRSKNTLLFSHDAKKHKMKLGMGVAGVANYSANNVFLDNFKTAAIWRHPATQDANGMPQTLAIDAGDGRPAATYVMPLPDGRVTPVKFRIITDGDLDINYWVYDQVTETAMTKEGNDYVFTWSGPPSMTRPDRNFLWLCIRAVRRAPTHLAMVRDDEAAHFRAGNIFRPAFKAEMKKFAWVRMMNWAASNWLDPVNVPEGYITYMGQGEPLKGGVPLSVQVKLCLEAGVSGWFNAHIKTSDQDYQAMMVEMDKVKAAGLDVYVELSNEVWNGQFAQHTYATAQGKAMGYGVENTYLANLEWYGYRTGQLAKLSRGKGYRWVFGSQPVNQDYQPDFVFRGFQDSGAINSDIFGWITTNYASGTLSLQPETLPAGLDDKQRKWMRERDYDAAINNVVSEPWTGGYGIPNVARYQAQAIQVANARGWKVLHYEGNVYHCNSVPYVINLDGYEEVFYNLPNHPLSRGATLVNLQVAEDCGVWGSTLFDFDSAPNSSEYGVFGHYGRATYDGLTDWIANMDSSAVVTPPIEEPEPEPQLPGYRYWRVTPTENIAEQLPGDTYWRWGFAEVVYRDATGLIDTSNFVPSTPADSTGNPVTRIFDVALDASWLSRGTDSLDVSKAVLNIDAGKAVRPTEIEFWAAPDLQGFCMSKGRIEASSDGQQWITLAEVSSKLTYTANKAVVQLVYS